MDRQTNPLTRRQPALPPTANTWSDTVSAQDYHNLAAASSSLLKIVADQTPAHGLAWLSEEEERTPALIFGSAAHCAILEPERFAAQYVERPEGLDRRTTAGKQQWADLEARYGSDRILSAEDLVRLRGMQRAIGRHRVASKILYAEGRANESTLIWYEQHHACKARLDLCLRTPDRIVVVDYKTTTDASAAGFARACDNFGYALQEAHYRAGVEETTGCGHVDFIWVAQEKEPPYAIGVYTLDLESLDLARARRSRALAAWVSAVRRGDYQGYPSQITEIGLPIYAKMRMQEESAWHEPVGAGAEGGAA